MAADVVPFSGRGYSMLPRPDSASSEDRVAALEARLERAALAVDASEASRLRENVRVLDKALEQATQGRHDTGFELARKELELRRVGDKLRKEEASKEQLSHERQTYVEQSNHLRQALRTVENEKKKVNTKATKLQRSMEERDAEVQALKQVSLAYAEDVKVHHTVESALEKQNQLLKSELKETRLQVKDLQRTLQNADLRVIEAEKGKDEHEKEVASLRTLASRLASEAESLRSSNSQVLEQWKSAMSALSQRDEVLSAVQTKALEERDRVEDVMSKRLDGEVTALTKLLEKERAERERQNQELVNLKADMSKIEEEKRTLKDAHRTETERRIRAEQAETDMKKAMEERLLRERDRGKENAVRLKSQVEALSNKLSDFEDATEKGGQHMAGQIRRLTKDLDEQEEENRRQITELTSKVSLLESQLVQSRANADELSQKNAVLVRQNDVLRQAHKDIMNESAKVEQLAEREESYAMRSEAQAAEMKRKLELLEKEGNADANVLRGKLKEQQKSYEKLENEYQRLKTAYVTAQQEILSSQKDSNKLAEARGNIMIMEHAENKLRSSLSRAEKEAVESSKEASLARLESEKSKAQVQALQDQNYELLVCLREAESHRAALIEKVDAEFRVLQREVQCLRGAKQDIVRVAAATERENTLLQSKYEAARDTVKTKIKQGCEAEREIVELNSKVRILSRRRKEDLKSMHTIAKHYETTFGKRLSERPAIAAARGMIAEETLLNSSRNSNGRLSAASMKSAPPTLKGQAGRPVLHEASMASQVSKATEDDTVSAMSMDTYSASVKHELSDKSDIFSEYNKMKTQLAEAQNNTVKLTNRFEQVAQSFIALDQKFNAVNQQNYNLNREVQTLKSEVLDMTNRCLRAEGIAASLESQLRRALPNGEIDYGYKPEIEPSPTLLIGFTKWQEGREGTGNSLSHRSSPAKPDDAQSARRAVPGLSINVPPIAAAEGGSTSRQPLPPTSGTPTSVSTGRTARLRGRH